MPPDISLTNGGGSAWTTRVTDSATDNVQIRFVNLTSLNTYTALLGYRTRLPPRIVSYGTDIALVVGVDTATGRWRLNRIRFSTSTRPNLSVDSIDFGVLGNQGSTDNFHNHIVSDFDFDCDRSGNGAQCVIAAALLEEDIGPLFGGANFSTVQTRRFSVVSSGTVASVIGSDWTHVDNSNRANSVIGLGLEDGGGKMYISAGVPVLTSSQTNNTRTTEYQTAGATTPLTSFSNKTDWETCQAIFGVNGSLSGASQHGGTSIAICPDCNGGSPTLESVHLGHQAGGGTECY